MMAGTEKSDVERIEIVPSRRISASRQPSQDVVHPALEDIDPSTKFLYTPHTVTGLLLGESPIRTGLFSKMP